MKMQKIMYNMGVIRRNPVHYRDMLRKVFAAEYEEEGISDKLLLASLVFLDPTLMNKVLIGISEYLAKETYPGKYRIGDPQLVTLKEAELGLTVYHGIDLKFYRCNGINEVNIDGIILLALLENTLLNVEVLTGSENEKCK